MKQHTSSFKWRHYEPTIILLCVRWYCRYQLSYRDVEEIMLSAKRDVSAAKRFFKKMLRAEHRRRLSASRAFTPLSERRKALKL